MRAYKNLVLGMPARIRDHDDLKGTITELEPIPRGAGAKVVIEISAGRYALALDQGREVIFAGDTFYTVVAVDEETKAERVVSAVLSVR